MSRSDTAFAVITAFWAFIGVICPILVQFFMGKSPNKGMLSVFASNHQGHPKYYGRGRQCVTNSYSAIIYHCQEKKASLWTQSDLDSILQKGDNLYKHLKTYGQKEEFLLVSDLPEQWQNYQLEVRECYAGSILNNNQDPPFDTLNQAISNIHSLMFLTIKCNTIAIIKDVNTYHVFDPHSRNKDGIVDSNGSAVLTSHNDIESLISFLQNLATSINDSMIIPFEGTSVNLSVINRIYTDSDDFDGFSEISDGEYNCLLYKMKEDEENEIQRIMNSYETSSSDDETKNSDYSTDDDIPLSTLSKFLKDQKATSNTSESEINSSGSEYVPSESERLILENSFSESDLSSSEEELSYQSIKIQKKKKGANENHEERVQCPIKASVDHSETDHTYFNCNSNNKAEVAQVENVLIGESENLINYTQNINSEWHDNQTQPDTVYITIEKNPEIAQEVIIETEPNFQYHSNQEAETSAENLDITNDSISSESEIPKYVGRKRTRNPSEWKRNKNKRSCNTGDRYKNSRGNFTQVKAVKTGCNFNCRYKCHSNFSMTHREEIFHTFWQLGDVNRQREFLLKYSNPQNKKSKKLASKSDKRQRSLMWSLPLNGNKFRVCKTFFLQTLNISAQRIKTCLLKSRNVSGLVELDQRGIHTNRPNKSNKNDIDAIIDHIKSFPVVESHYCRKSSNRKYLTEDLSVSKMYSLYVQACEEKHQSHLSLAMYRKIFNTKFNLSFNKPIKDQCDLCNAYRNATEIDQPNLKEKYENHIKNKILSREQKEMDKKNAQDGSYTSACFDLEQVLVTPKGFESSLYYKRRLNTYNFSIYNLGTGSANCFIWNESLSGRGACEIASCVYDFLKQMSQKGQTKFVLYSDNCSAQNKNKYYLTMLWYSIQELNLDYIEQKYLEKGHTQNENDSVHACIERASRSISIYTPGQWAAVAKSACRKKPYIVKEMGLPNFFDFKAVSKFLRNFDLDIEKNKVQWNSIRTFRINSSNPNIVEIKYDYDGSTHYLDLAHRIRRSNTIPNIEDVNLQRLLNDGPKISLDKYKDLIWLCKSGIIPQCHHMFFAFTFAVLVIIHHTFVIYNKLLIKRCSFEKKNIYLKIIITNK